MTNAQFGAFLKATGYAYDEKLPRGKDDHPVVNVNWAAAAAFCAWAAQTSGQPVRLPTEGEFEKAARGTDGRTYPWGEQQPDRQLCNFNELFSGTTPVGQFSPKGDSPYGCTDLAGNVWEWCVNGWDRHALDKNPGPNPQGTVVGKYRVVRGGSWLVNPSDVRTTCRNGRSDDFRNGNLGFRASLLQTS